jgi:hypothetical protein
MPLEIPKKLDPGLEANWGADVVLIHMRLGLLHHREGSLRARVHPGMFAARHHYSPVMVFG